MRIVEEKIYLFHELDESAKERAREWYREGIELTLIGWQTAMIEKDLDFAEEA